MFETVVIATDGSASGERAVAVAIDLADRFDATVHALSVVDTGAIDATPSAVQADVRVAMEERVEAAVEAVADRNGEVRTAVRHGDPGEEIVEYVRDVDADLVATGTRGRHGEGRLVLGSVAERVVRTSPAPVLTVRQLETE